MERVVELLELINKVEKIIEVKKLNLVRRKKRYEVFIDEADNYYWIMSLLISIKSWEECLKLLKKYDFTRERVTEFNRSKSFEALFEANKKYNSSLITERDRFEILEYMKTLEWKIDSINHENKAL